VRRWRSGECVDPHPAQWVDVDRYSRSDNTLRQTHARPLLRAIEIAMYYFCSTQTTWKVALSAPSPGSSPSNMLSIWVAFMARS